VTGLLGRPDASAVVDDLQLIDLAEHSESID
jgi:hypothetical protein